MSDRIGLSDLEIGVSHDGMSQYRANLKAELLTQTASIIDSQYDNIVSELRKGWQGVSEQRFETQFSDICEKIKDDLKQEYYDLEARLIELESFYFKQDTSLIED